MKKILTNFLPFVIVLVGCSSQLLAQTFIFPVVNTPASCVDSYALRTGIKVMGVQLNNIYYDDGTNGSFGFEMVLRYGNIFEGNVVSMGNFYTYKATLYTTAPQVSGPIANNGGNIPLVTDTSSNVTLNNNPSYNGSASALGLTTGVLYTSQSIIDIFGYDSATLEINLPCISDTVLPGMVGTLNGAPLAVTLSGLNAVQKGHIVVLSWNTFSEKDNAGFRVERSSDGKNWLAINYIKSMARNGNSNAKLSYEWIDNTPFEGDNYYRVLEIDQNNTTKASAVTKVNYRVTNNLVPAIYPNPARGYITISNLNNENIYYELLSSSGRLVKSGYLANSLLDVSDVVNGFYVLKTAEGRLKCVVMH